MRKEQFKVETADDVLTIAWLVLAILSYATGFVGICLYMIAPLLWLCAYNFIAGCIIFHLIRGK